MKKFLILILIFFISFSMIGCNRSKQRTETNKLTTVNVAFDVSPSESGVILADKLGYFEKQGIKINYVKFNSGADELSAIASNQVDVSRGIINAGLFNAWNRGIGIKLVADGGHNIPGRGFFQIALKKGLGAKVKDFKDLKGLRIAIASTGSINELFVQKALEKGGLTDKDISFVVVDSFPDMLTAVANGSADATMQIEPLITKGVEEGILEWWKDPDEYIKGEEISVVMYSPNFSRNKDLGNRFMIAYIQGVRAYNDAFITSNKNQDKIIDILIKNTFVNTKDTFKKMKPPGLDPNGYVLKKGVINDLKWYMEKGLVKETPDINKFVDNTYVENALKILGKYKAPQ